MFLDELVYAVTDTPTQLRGLLTAKGGIFVGLSGVLIYGLTKLREQQLGKARDRLQATTEQLRVIERIFRHNLRNEMTVVTGYSEVVYDQLTDDQLRGYLEKSLRSSNRLISLSNKLSLINQVDLDRTSNDRIDLVELTEQNWDDLQAKAPEGTLKADLPEQAHVEGDHSFVYAIRELIENAVEHNDKPPESQEIRLRIDQSDGTTTLRVSDNGPGIPEHEMEALRAGGETALFHGGGLGLWLVKWLAQVNGGEVDFEHTEEGTTVSIHLESVTKVEAVAQKVESAVEEVIEDIEEEVQRVASAEPGQETY